MGSPPTGQAARVYILRVHAPRVARRRKGLEKRKESTVGIKLIFLICGGGGRLLWGLSVIKRVLNQLLHAS